jgi:hypothetical protein
VALASWFFKFISGGAELALASELIYATNTQELVVKAGGF